jgi:hypothetical protein
VLDVDDLDALRQMEEKWGELPETFTVKTGRVSGGLHLHFRHPGGDVRTRVLEDGVELKAAGGQVVMPPSIHPNGRRYIVTKHLPVASLPGTWVRHLSDHAVERPVLTSGSKIGEGGRNTYLTREAGRIRRLGLSEGVIGAALEQINLEVCEPPLDGREVARIAKSVASYDAKDGRHHGLIPGSSDDDDDLTRFRWRNGREICELAPENPDWIAYRLLVPGAITQLTGQIKLAGKTTFALALSRAVIQGRDFLGGPTQQMPVVYLTEQAHATFGNQVRYARLDDQDNFISLSYDEHASHPWPGFVTAAVAKCVEVGSKLLVIDTIGPFSGLHGEAENQQGAAREVLHQLIAAKNQGIAVLIVRHQRKSGGDIASAGVGAIAWGGGVDILANLEHRASDGTKQRTLGIHGRFPPHNGTLKIEPDRL